MDELNLIKAAQKEDENAFKELLAKYSPIVLRLRRKYAVLDLTYNEWIQEGRIALGKALATYRFDRGVTFGMYYKNILNNQLCSEHRRQNAGKRVPASCQIPLENAVQQYEKMQADYDKALILHESLDKGQLILSKTELLVLQKYLAGLDFPLIAIELGLELKTVKGAFSRMKRKFVSLLESCSEDY